MRIASQNTDIQLKQPTVVTNNVNKVDTVEPSQTLTKDASLDTKQNALSLDPNSVEKLEKAVDTINEVLESANKASKFVLHEGLDKYFVRLIDSETEEVIKEIPPERILDAYYELQKLAGMIVDEKI